MTTMFARIRRRLERARDLWRRGGPGAVRNAWLMRRAFRRRGEAASHSPIYAQVEVTTACNLRCSTCREHADLFSPEVADERSMSLAQFEAILRQLPYLEFVCLQGVGEPLMNKDLFGMIDAAHRRGIQVGFSANGMILTPSIVEKILDHQVEQLSFSIDGATRETFEKIRRGARFDQVLNNIRRFMQAREARRAVKPEVSVTTVAGRANEHELLQIITLVHDLGIRHMILKSMLELLQIPAVTANLLAQEKELTYVRECQAHARRLGVLLTVSLRCDPESPFSSPGQKWTQSIPHNCPWPYERTYITVGGYVTPCCYNYDPMELNLGNVFTEGFGAVWDGERARALRMAMRDGREIPRACRTCPGW